MMSAFSRRSTLMFWGITICLLAGCGSEQPNLAMKSDQGVETEAVATPGAPELRDGGETRSDDFAADDVSPDDFAADDFSDDVAASVSNDFRTIPGNGMVGEANPLGRGGGAFETERSAMELVAPGQLKLRPSIPEMQIRGPEPTRILEKKFTHFQPAIQPLSTTVQPSRALVQPPRALVQPPPRPMIEQPREIAKIERTVKEVSEPIVTVSPPVDPSNTELSEAEFKTVNVFYGTDRLKLVATTPPIPVATRPGLVATVLLLAGAVVLLVFNRWKSSLVTAFGAVILFALIANYHNDSPNRQGVAYGVERGKLVRGIATVTVPKTHQRGIVERPSILRLEFEEDQTKHVVLAKAVELDPDTFYKKMSSEFRQSSERELLVFVHGFNVDFDSAVRRTAQISTDLGFNGVPICYSWPSQGTLIGYTVDENNVNWTEPHLRAFLLELAEKSDATSINIIAHSMGNRALTTALGKIRFQLPEEQLPFLDQVVLAAPDIDADHFRNELAPLLAEVSRHVTLYASSDDRALIASKQLHGGYPRAGESGENLVVVADIETIDATGIDLSLLGHSYYGTSESMLRDLFEVVRNRRPASQRAGLISRKLRDTTYWLLQRPSVSELPDTQHR